MAETGDAGVVNTTAARVPGAAAASTPDSSPEPSWLPALFEELMFGGRASRFWRGVWLVAVALATVSALLVANVHADVLPAVGIPLAGLATAPIVLLRRAPVAGIVLVAAANGVFLVDSRLPWPPTAVLVWLVALAACPLVMSRRLGLLIVAGSEAAALAGACVPHSVNVRPWDAPITEALAVLLAWGIGETLRSRRESETQRVATNARLRELQERDALAQGRTGIARELHDIVAHHVSLIAVRAATAPYQLGDVSPDTRAAFEEIAAQARTALDELRAVLGVLRTPDGTALQTPQAGLADLGELIERMKESGMHIDVRTDGSPPPLTSGVELCCFRLIQEALTNAARHAPGAPVQIDIDYGSDISVRISNPAKPTVPDRGETATGFGLTGMRERVTALGGHLEIGLAENTFQLRALIPAGSGGSHA
jgi:signal transduction histidine kinase